MLTLYATYFGLAILAAYCLFTVYIVLAAMWEGRD